MACPVLTCIALRGRTVFAVVKQLDDVVTHVSRLCCCCVCVVVVADDVVTHVRRLCWELVGGSAYKNIRGLPSNQGEGIDGFLGPK